jgi:hypothetical protein
MSSTRSAPWKTPDIKPSCRTNTRARDHLDVAELHEESFIAHVGQARSVMGALVTSLCADSGFAQQIRHEVAETSTLVTLRRRWARCGDRAGTDGGSGCGWSSLSAAGPSAWSRPNRGTSPAGLSDG